MDPTLYVVSMRYDTRSRQRTCAVLGPVIEDLVDDGPSVLFCGGPVVGCLPIVRLFELILSFLIIVRDLC